jgi:hypothetical protein
MAASCPVQPDSGTDFGMAGSRAVPLPLVRLLPLIFGGAAVVAILTTLTGFGGWVTDGAFVLALLVAAVHVVLLCGGRSPGGR